MLTPLELEVSEALHSCETPHSRGATQYTNTETCHDRHLKHASHAPNISWLSALGTPQPHLAVFALLGPSTNFDQ